MQVVTIKGTPDSVAKIPVIKLPPGSPVYDYNPPLLPRDAPDWVVAQMSSEPDTCPDAGIVKVCIRGKCPPDRLPGHQYFFPQRMCDWSHVFCNEGQESASDNERQPGSETSGKTQAELDEICVNNNKVEIDVCKAHFPPSRQYREYKVCEEQANRRMYACFATASKLTDNGAHPAP
ncbi:hypothetical protein NX773_11620 [Massilia solisilvae]|uniref:Uncharacterized protein n=1 Tax=Massilia solisilvae TaxID=1811225 RepID=A0ABT2BJX8_9BURK|nr:hypothetical protein [Massilia solisilvae]MCS0608815.1 hypothetical protein [Massilia solisilvae]